MKIRRFTEKALHGRFGNSAFMGGIALCRDPSFGRVKMNIGGRIQK